MSQNFKDYFSKQSDVYVKSRPGYPEELFEFLASVTSEHKIAWDCATGNGQAAVPLTKYFKKVIATDASAQQISNAVQHPQIEYRTSRVEESGLADNSIDLVTSATGVHWFDLDKYYPEVKRVLKPDGVIAVWTYGKAKINPELNKIMDKFFFETLKDYWPKETKVVWEKYKTLHFPFDEINAPEFTTTTQEDFHRTVTYLQSLSPTQNYIAQHGENPVEKFIPELEKAWGDISEKKDVKRKISMRVGRNSK